MSHTDPYLARGVSSTKDDVHKAIEVLPPSSIVGAFCQVMQDPDNDESLQIIHADGAGSKSSVAYLVYKETGDARVFEGIAQDSLAMNIDDMICVGAYENFLISNTIGRNSHRVGADVLTSLLSGYARSVQQLNAIGIRSTLCGGETADLGDLVKTVVVDSTIYAKLPKSRLINCAGISPGNVIVGFSSSGKATYENTQNSGIGSNGFTAAKHVLLSSYYRDKYPETFAETIHADHVYTGSLTLDDQLAGATCSVAEALLSPTRTYAPVVKEICRTAFSAIHGIIHCTGGGLTKSMKFGTGLMYVKDNLFPLPPIFSAIQRSGMISDRDMWRIFNCGHRLEVYCDASATQQIIDIGSRFGIDTKIIGRVEASGRKTNGLSISHNGSIAEY